MNFGEILQRELNKQGKTQVWLAEQMGVTPGAITKYLNGNPTWKVIQRINKVLPLPEAAGLLHSRERLAGYVGNDGQTSPEILSQLESLTLAYSDVLEDPDARADFAELVQVIVELSQEQRRGLLQFVKGFDKREILQDGS